MSTVSFPLSAPELTVITVPTLVDVVLRDDVVIPAGITDLASFRQWAYSDDFPKVGRISYLQGEIWVDLSMEQLYSHNQLKAELTRVLHGLAAETRYGLFMPDGMRLSNPDVELSTQPDGMFASYDAIRDGRVRQVPGRSGGFTELGGAPEMVLEIISDSSIEKDTVRLPEVYLRAGVAEFWRIDARGGELRFEILRREEAGYVPALGEDGWWRSEVFGHWFRLVQQPNPLGHPSYTLESRP